MEDTRFVMLSENYVPQFPSNDVTFATKAIHAGQEAEQWNSRAVVPPISLSTTFKQDGPAQYKQYEYSRSGNPTRDVLESCLAALDKGQYGVVFASGLAATAAVVHLLDSGDHIVAMNDLYGGTNRYFRKGLLIPVSSEFVVKPKMNIDTTFVDATNVAKVTEALRPNTKLIWIETPTNPTLKICDIQSVVGAVKAVNCNALIVVDNTFLTSYFQRPLTFGADIAYYSLTKYVNGHTDVVMGACVTSDISLAQRLRFLQNAVGSVPSPFECYLVNRSLKTLKIRMEEHYKNGLAVARFLAGHPKVQRVIHPALPSHPQHDIALRQQFGHSGMISFYLRDGATLDDSRRFLSTLKVVTLAESLGGYESLAELPYLMTHASIDENERVALGVTSTLIRLSVGLENFTDVIADLDAALAVVETS